jgi:hypothetical protein
MISLQHFLGLSHKFMPILVDYDFPVLESLSGSSLLFSMYSDLSGPEIE